MNVDWLIKELQKADPSDEVIVTVEDVGLGEVSGGILCKVTRSGEGARVGQCEIYAKG